MSSRWLRRGKNRSPSFKPSLCVLEDRVVPSSTHSSWFYSPPPPGPAVSLEVEAPSNIKVGQSFYVEVEAKDANHRLATGYVGTVQFSLGTTDANAVLPANFTFTTSDHGEHWFSVTLYVTGSQKIIATDATTATITGSAATTVNPAPAATHFVVYSPKYVTAGVPVTVTVIALDKYNHVATGYTGSVQFTNTDGNAPALSNYQFVPHDDGQHTFQATFDTTGPQTLTVTDTLTSTITGKDALTVEAVGSVTHFAIWSFGFTSLGVAMPLEIVALDANNHVVAGYTGTVHFTSSDGSAVLPADYTFLPSDNGEHALSVTFNKVGKQTVTATDKAAAAITGTVHVRVQQRSRFPWGGGWGWF